MIYDISVVDADGEVDDLGLEKPGQEIPRKFDKRGKYKVRCTVDPMMKITITVQ